MEHLKPGDPSRVGNYRLIGRLGEGGMGQVFLGLSPGGRQVAVKVIHPGYASGKQFRERFAREIEAARRVGGFHTASVVDADPGADPPWMVTAFIQGPSLQQAVAEGGPFSLERVCRLGAGLAEGLAAIHACGLVHRDLKPSNVILADDGPRIIDFGIARAAEASPMTTAGMVVGTYSYMSPEQLRGEVAGPASDVFALGCTLAFAATARITFGDDSIVTVVYRITTEPPDLSGVTEEHGFRDLVRDCLSKSPASRPSLATIMDRLAETGTAAQAVLADPAADYWHSVAPASRPAAEPVSRPAAEEPGPRVPAPEPPLPYVAAAGPQPYSYAAPPEPKPYPSAAPPEPKPYPYAAESATGQPPASAFYEPTQTMRTGDRAGPGQDSDQQRTGPAGPPPDQRPIWAAAPPPPRSGRGGGARRTVLIVAAAAVVVVGAVVGILLSSSSPTTSHPMAVQSSAHTGGHPSASATVRSSPAAGVPSGPALSLHDPGGKNVFGDVFSSETTLVTGDSNGSSYIWDLSTGGSLTGTLKDPNSNGINSIAFNPGSNTYAMADANGNIYLWNAASGKITATLSNGSRDDDRVAISPDGRMVAVGSNGGSTYLWKVGGSSTAANSFHDPGGKNVYGVAFSPDGNTLAAGDTDGSTYLWNVSTGQLTSTLKDPGSKGLYDVAFSPNGNLLAVSDESSTTTDGVVYLWNVSTGTLVNSLESFYNSEFADIAFTPDSKYLAAGDTIGNVSFWNAGTGKYLDTVFDPLGKGIIGIAFSPSGDALASTDTAGDAYVWNTKWLGS
ncbi:MAG TPA: protein kinase [Streptosporangiaceae bacterium]|nr:protein kinase [Streptosporangiaceae bacterium]